MATHIVTLREEINRIAEKTQAPPAFVTQIKKLFIEKGIALDSDSAHYTKALVVAFNGELQIRTRLLKVGHGLGDIKRRLQCYTNLIRKRRQRLQPMGEQQSDKSPRKPIVPGPKGKQ